MALFDAIFCSDALIANANIKVENVEANQCALRKLLFYMPDALKSAAVFQDDSGLRRTYDPSCSFLQPISGQAEKEFRVAVEAIGHVRHKNLILA
ncbi:putative receptor-like protein kinase [Platanthera guangdongensis]|uniref:Receptor-like protein kinase n=1 Tax=Platanthera guangdongensis TaxID=2320717 RepID=A0ABR2M5X6_9ASPA